MNGEEQKQLPQERLSLSGRILWMALGFLLALVFWGKIDPSVTKFKLVRALVQEYYVEEVDPEKFSEDILAGGISKACDPHSRYLNKKEVKRETNEIMGEFGGIGIRIDVKENLKYQSYDITIVSVLDKTPAQKAGLKAGDIIRAISSTSSLDSQVLVEDLSLNEVVDLIGGKPGTKVWLWVLRQGKIKKFTLTRETIKIESVHFKVIKGGIGYIKIDEFSSLTCRSFNEAVDKLLAKGVKSLIIDVRNNPGGLLITTLEIITGFRKDFNFPPVYTKGRDGKYELRNLDVDVKEQAESLGWSRAEVEAVLAPYKNLKVVVLINKYSASASELLAGWFKEEFGAPIVGQKSFGKGSVQTPFLLSDGSKLVLTTDHYFIGKNKLPVHGIGIKPTIEVENTENQDRQLDKAIEAANDLLK